MLDWLFNGVEMMNATKGLVIAAGVIAIIFLILWILYKTRTFSPFFKTFSKVIAFGLGLCLILSGVYSYVYINAYYKKEGGVYGQLSNVVYNSIQEVQEEKNTITYSFNNLVFKADENEEYSITFIQDYKDEDYRTRFLEGTNYSIFVYNNGDKYECNNIKYDTEWIIAEYSYVFFGSYNENDVIADDTLHFDFCFYENYSYLKITSDADYSTIQLWDSYFQKYNFEVVIEVVDEVFISEKFSESIIDGIIQITYIFDLAEPPTREVYDVRNSDEVLEIKTDYTVGIYFIKTWTDKNGKEITSIPLNKSNNITLYAVAYDITESLEVNYYNLDGSEILETRYYTYGEAVDLSITPESIGLRESGKRFTFQGWTTTPVEPINNGVPEYGNQPIIFYINTITESINLYPVFTYINVAVWA